MKQYAAAADPSTPQWVLNRIAAQQLRAFHRMHFVLDHCDNLLTALFSNPALSADTLEAIIGSVIAPRSNGDVPYQTKWSALALQHPHVSSKRRSHLIDKGIAAAGFSALEQELHGHILSTGNLWPVSLAELGNTAQRIMLAAHHLTLPEKDLAKLFSHLSDCLTRFSTACDEFRHAHGAIALEGNAALQRIGKMVGTSVALLVTHPLAAPSQQDDLIKPLTHEGHSLSWIHTIEAMEWIEETSHHHVHLLCEARAPEGFSPPTNSPSIGEIGAWGSVIRGLMQAAPRSGDAKTLAAVFRRDAVIVSHATRLPGLGKRIAWTKDLVRTCLLSPWKNLRELGLEGAASLAAETQDTTAPVSPLRQDDRLGIDATESLSPTQRPAADATRAPALDPRRDISRLRTSGSDITAVKRQNP